MAEDEITVKLTPKQWTMINFCVEYITANERDFDSDDEETLKEIADIFEAEYVEMEDE